MSHATELKAPKRKQLPDQQPGPTVGVLKASMAAIMIGVHTRRNDTVAVIYQENGL
jgi:hypothetical protein